MILYICRIILNGGSFMKKLLSCLLVIVMCLSFTGFAFAADGTVSVMKAYGYGGNENMQAYKSEIESLEFTLSDVRENIVNNGDVWDISAEGNGKVFAWLEDTDKDGLYEAYISAKGEYIYANENCSYLFRDYSALKKISGMNLFKTDNVRYMESMFEGCSSLSILDVQYFNTSKVVTMKSIFKNCSSLVSFIGLNKLDTSSVVLMDGMFYGCKSLVNLNLASFDTRNVTDMSYMFYGCEDLTVCDFGYEDSNIETDFAKNTVPSKFSTTNVTDMSYMFSGCSSLKELNLNGFDTYNVKKITEIFFNCSSAELIDLSNWSFASMGGRNLAVYRILDGCKSLKKLYVYNIKGFDAELHCFETNFNKVSNVRIYTDNRKFEESLLWKNVLKYMEGSSIIYDAMPTERAILTFTVPTGVSYYCISEIGSDKNDFVFEDSTRSYPKNTKLKIRLYGNYDEYTFHLDGATKTVLLDEYVYIVVLDDAAIYAVGNGTSSDVVDDQDKGSEGDVANNFLSVFYILFNRIVEFFKKLFGLA